MTHKIFHPFDKELVQTWQLFARHWKTAIIIALLPIIPLLFVTPLVIETTLGSDISAISVYTAIFAIIATTLVWWFVHCCLFNVFASKKGTIRKFLSLGMKRYGHFLWTEFLVIFIVAILLIPPLLFQAWYETLGSQSIAQTIGQGEGFLLVYLITLLLFIPGTPAPSPYARSSA